MQDISEQSTASYARLLPPIYKACVTWCGIGRQGVKQNCFCFCTFLHKIFKIFSARLLFDSFVDSFVCLLVSWTFLCECMIFLSFVFLYFFFSSRIWSFVNGLCVCFLFSSWILQIVFVDNSHLMTDSFIICRSFYSVCFPGLYLIRWACSPFSFVFSLSTSFLFCVLLVLSQGACQCTHMQRGREKEREGGGGWGEG